MSVDIINMSLEMKPGEFHEDDQIQKLFKKAFEAGITVVLAAGNYGPLINTLSPISIGPWVIGVGAASKDGKRLADFSSRGIPGDELYKPTIVAPGVDMVGLWPEGKKKTLTQYNRDKKLITSEELYRQTGRHVIISKKMLEICTVMSGTSQAAAIVSGLAAKIIEMRRLLKLPSDPTTVKEVFLDMAVPMPNYEAHEVGAGFVSVFTAIDYFDSLDNSEKISSEKLWSNHRGLKKR